MRSIRILTCLFIIPLHPDIIRHMDSASWLSTMASLNSMHVARVQDILVTVIVLVWRLDICNRLERHAQPRNVPCKFASVLAKPHRVVQLIARAVTSLSVLVIGRVTRLLPVATNNTAIQRPDNGDAVADHSNSHFDSGPDNQGDSIPYHKNRF